MAEQRFAGTKEQMLEMREGWNSSPFMIYVYSGNSSLTLD